MSFGAARAHAEAVCGVLERAGMTWCAYVRPDEIDAGFARLLHRSGCRQVQLGVESGDALLRVRYGKSLSDAVLHDAVAASRAASLRVGCHLVLGIPGEDSRTLWRTRRLLRALRPDYVSLNVAEPRWGSADQVSASTDTGARPSPGALRAARAALYCDYYLRPSYLLPTLVRAWRDAELGELARLGLSLATRSLRARR